MSKQIFLNFPVKHLQPSMDFYLAMGFSNNPQFSDDSAKCMVWSEHIYVMIMTHEKFASFVHKPIGDARPSMAAIYSLSVSSVEEMNQIMENALAAGGKEPVEMRDYGFMQQRTLEDLDGNVWEVFFMDMSKMG